MSSSNNNKLILQLDGEALVLGEIVTAQELGVKVQDDS
jgi:hypothetical protein